MSSLSRDLSLPPASPSSQTPDQIMTRETRATCSQAVVALSIALAFLLNPLGKSAIAAKSTGSPNILFFIMDDVGIDQMKIFGYGGATPPRTPNIDAVAHAGVRFRNTWAMPECSPSRAMFFEGRYPFRTNVLSAILSLDLANSQMSPFEVTTPQVLKQQGYASALFGKLHLSGSYLNSDNNPLGDGVAHALGWDYFAGYLDGAPFPVDSTAGGVGQIDQTTGQGPYGCGFVPNTTDNPTHGADEGACYHLDGTCTDLSRSLTHPTPGRTCLEDGGIFVPLQSCQSPPPNLAFENQNAYYVSRLVINHENGSVETIPPTDPRARGYRTILESDLAIDWVKQRPAQTPWMATVSYSSAHAPYQQPPAGIFPLASVNTNSFDCVESDQLRVLSNQMIEAIDTEIGRVLVELGLATRGLNGALDYRPEETNTMVVIIGDNGTFFPGVKLPFDPLHSKATVYQTGVWVPLIVAGPLVNAPDREVRHMVNAADLFELFGEIAGVDVHKIVPKSHNLDSASMLPYLTTPTHGSIRKTNFTEIADNLRATDVVSPPCVIPSVNACIQTLPQEEACDFEQGEWYGPNGIAGPDGLDSCCAVNTWLQENDPSRAPVNILPYSQLAIRNERFKLVQVENVDCDNPGQFIMKTGFYEINELPGFPKIDRPGGYQLPDGQILPGNNLLTTQPNLTPLQKVNLKTLSAELQQLLDSQPPCPGDGNLDRVVNAEDIDNWQFFSAENGGNSSWYDFDLDGKTSSSDLDIIQQNLGKCPKKNQDAHS